MIRAGLRVVPCPGRGPWYPLPWLPEPPPLCFCPGRRATSPKPWPQKKSHPCDVFVNTGLQNHIQKTNFTPFPELFLDHISFSAMKKMPDPKIMQALDLFQQIADTNRHIVYAISESVLRCNHNFHSKLCQQNSPSSPQTPPPPHFPQSRNPQNPSSEHLNQPPSPPNPQVCFNTTKREEPQSKKVRRDDSALTAARSRLQNRSESHFCLSPANFSQTKNSSDAPSYADPPQLAAESWLGFPRDNPQRFDERSCSPERRPRSTEPSPCSTTPPTAQTDEHNENTNAPEESPRASEDPPHQWGATIPCCSRFHPIVPL